MATPPSDPATPSPSGKPRKSPSALDTHTLEELTRDEQIALAAKQEMSTNPGFVTALSTHFLDAENTVAITPASISQLAQQAKDAQETAQRATTGTADLRNVSAKEEQLKKALLASIKNVQTRAKEKYGESAPAKLKSYYVGEAIASRAQIEEAGASIVALVRNKDDSGHPITPQDTLPGLTDSGILDLTTNFDAYVGVQADQTLALGDASSARGSFKEQCKQIARRRRKLQLAIDAEYPPGEDHAAFRKQFGLQGDKAMG